ncbi:tetratricopeptide repeat protein [Clostridioides difficile]|uniref:tetratricopeptide repeat protein n=1 Tax=Clostridioides difficile TaxID=1496 RepID=UPI0021C9A427|nr:hypothetical protein [Clostridioides difficile]UUV15976.1 hypothetical protein NQ183_06715 [Clostridioides difficile]
MNITNKCVLGISVLAILSFGFSAFQGNTQIAERKKDYNIYLEANSDKENVKSSLDKITELEKKYGESDALSLSKVELYKKAKDYKSLQNEIEKVYNKYPQTRKTASFILLYSEVALKNGDKELAKQMITEAIQLGAQENYKDRADKVLSQLK